MIDTRATLRRLGGSLTRIRLGERTPPPGDRDRVFRTGSPANGVDAWHRMIIEQDDGGSVAEIIENLYADELSTGAWAVDIALWKDLFDRRVRRSISALAHEGYIKVEPHEGRKEHGDG